MKFDELRKIQESHCDLVKEDDGIHCRTHKIIIKGEEWPFEDCPHGTCEKAEALIEYGKKMPDWETDDDDIDAVDDLDDEGDDS